jgi:hypothetical protein
VRKEFKGGGLGFDVATNLTAINYELLPLVNEVLTRQGADQEFCGATYPRKNKYLYMRF